MAAFSPGASNSNVTNYARIGHCSQDTIPAILQELLLSKEPTHQIQADCLSNIYLSRNLRADERLLIKNAPINGYNNFDIPFIYKLLRNLNLVPSPTKGWDHPTPPAGNELTIGDDIERLRRKRNAILHRGNTNVSDTELTDTFDIFKDIANRLEVFLGKTNAEFVSKFQHIETCCMDEQSETLFIDAMKNTAMQEFENNEKIKEVMEKTEKNMEQTEINKEQTEKNKEQIEKNTESIRQLTSKAQDRQQQIIQQWTQNDAKFIRTECSVKLFNDLKVNTIVNVVGNPGMGKTVTSRHVALKMHESDYDVYDVRSPLEILENIVADKKMLFVIDDICGKYSVAQHEVEEWERNMEYIENCLASKSIKMLTTCRLQVFQSRQFKELQLLTSCRFNMLEKENEITVKEKRMIADSYTTTKFSCQMSDEEIQQFDSFPLLCRMSAIFNDSITEILSFMRKPFTVFEKEIDKLGIQTDRMFIAALGMIVIFNNELHEDILKEDINDQQRKIFDDVFEACGEQRGSSRNRILSCLDAFEDVYIIKHDSCYSFLHTKIFDLFSSYFGKNKMMLTAMLKYCNLSFLSGRCWFCSLGAATDESLIPLPDEKEYIFLQRILREVKNETLFDVFTCKLMDIQEFRTRIIATLQQLGFDVISRLLKLSNFGTTILHISCQHGYRELLIFLLKYNIPLNECDWAGRTPLHDACRYGDKYLVEILINAGVERNSYKMRGFTPLFDACLFGKTDVVDMLLKSGSDPNLHTKRLLIPLVVASENGYSEIVELLLLYQADVDQINANGETALHLACKNCHIEVIRSLIQNGANVNIKTNFSESPLYLATIDPKSDIITLLLSEKADPTATSQAQLSPVTLAIKNGRHDIAHIMLQSMVCSDAIFELLEYAIKIGNVELVKAIAECDIDINMVLSSGYTSLQIACQENSLSISSILVKNGADANFWSEDGETPTQLAVLFNHKDIVSFLVDNGADVNCSDLSKGMPPALHIACLLNQNEIVKVLVETNADVNESAVLTIDMIHKIRDANYIQELCDRIGNLSSIAVCPLEIAVFERNDIIVELLITAGADINIRTAMGIRPLMVSCFYENIKITELLLKHKVDTNAVSDIVKLCLTYLSSTGEDDIIEMLPINRKLKGSPATALHVSTLTNNTRLVSMLLRHRSRTNILCNIDPVLIAVLTDKVDTRSFNLDYVAAQLNRSKTIKNVLPVHLSCIVGNVEIFEIICNSLTGSYQTLAINVTTDQLLRTQGIFVNKFPIRHPRTFSFTPLQLAAMRHHWDICKILLKQGVENICMFEVSASILDGLSGNVQSTIGFNDRHIFKTSVAHLAYENGHIDLLEIIFSSGVSVDIGNDSKFHIACSIGDIHIVKQIYKINADINVQNDSDNGKSPLHVATEKNRQHLVEFLLSKDAIIDMTDNDGNTPLHIACICGFKKIANALLKKNAYPFAVNKGGENAFHLSCKHNKTKCLSLLLNFSNAEDENEYNDTIHHTNILNSVGTTPFYFAFLKNNKKMVKMLIAHGADINQRINDNGETLIFLACKEKRLGWVKCLIKKSADINICDIDHHSPIYMTCRSGFDEITSELLKHNVDVNRACYEGCTPLYFCCLRSKSKLAEKLLLKNADPNALSNTMESLLIESCRNGRKRIVKLLLKHGADVNYCHFEGETALYFAFVSGNATIMRILLDHNASWNVCAHEREYFLYLACKENMVDIIYLMMEYENTINVNAIAFKGETPFYMCCKHLSINLVNFLTEFGGDINMLINEKDTPFHQICLHNDPEQIYKIMQRGSVSAENIQREFIYSCDYKRMDIVDLIYNKFRHNLVRDSLESAWFSAVNNNNVNIIRLLAKEININTQGEDGRTALHIASANGNSNLVEELLTFSQINVGLKSQKGLSALHVACAYNNVNVVRMLLKHNSDIRENTGNGTTPLMLACICHKANIIDYLFVSEPSAVIQQFIQDANTILTNFYNIPSMTKILRLMVGLCPKDACISEGDKAIHFACRINDTELLEFLLDLNHDVNSSNECDETPISICIYLGNNETLEVLLNANASVNTVSSCHGRTTLPFRFEQVTPLHLACFSDNILATKRLLSRKVSYNCSTNIYRVDTVTSKERVLLKSCSPIHLAVCFASSELFEMLLKYFIDTKWQYSRVTVSSAGFIDEDVDVAAISLNLFQLACFLDEIKKTKTLLELQVFDIDEPFAVTPMLLSMADCSESSSLMKLIMQIYGYKDQQNVAYVTPVFFAALVKCNELVKILIESYADEDKGSTLSLLHIIALEKNIIEVILSKGNIPFLLDECTVNTVDVLFLREQTYLFEEMLTYRFMNMNSYAKLNVLHVVCFRAYANHLKLIIDKNKQTLRQFQIKTSHLSLMTSHTVIENTYIGFLHVDFSNCIRLSATEIACFIYDSGVLERLFLYTQANYTDYLLELSPLLLLYIFGDFEKVTMLSFIQNLNFCSSVSHSFLYALLCSDTEPKEYMGKELLQEKCQFSELASLFFILRDETDDKNTDIYLFLNLLSLSQTVLNLNLIQISFYRKDYESMDTLIRHDDLIRRAMKLDCFIIGCIQNNSQQSLSLIHRRNVQEKQAMEFSPLELYYLRHKKIPDNFLESQKARTMTVMLTPLVIACLHDNTSNVKLVLLENRSEVNTVFEPSSLHLMCFVCNTFFYLINNTFFNHIPSITASVTALHVACLKQNDAIVTMLLGNHSNVNIQAVLSPIHIALLLNSDHSCAILKEYMDAGPLRLGNMDALHITALFKRGLGLKSILRVSCNFESTAKLTSLHLYLLSGYLWSVKLKDNNYNAYSELSALHITILTDNDDNFQALLRRGADIEQRAYVYPLHIEFDYYDNLSEMITEISIFSLTPLQLACIKQNSSICKALVRKSANIHTNAFLFLEFQVSDEVIIHTYSSLSIVFLAFLVNDMGIARMVLDLAPNVNEKSVISLWHICFFLPRRMLKLQNFKKEVVLNMAPLHLASVLNNKDFVIMLLDNDADANAIAELSPLYATLYNTDETEVSVNSHINERRLILRTPLHLAAEAGYIDICEILLLYGADTGAETNVAGLHPWHLALYHSHINVLRRLLSRPSKIEKAKFLFVLLLYIIRKRYNIPAMYMLSRSRYFIILHALYRYVMGVFGFRLCQSQKLSFDQNDSDFPQNLESENDNKEEIYFVRGRAHSF